MLYFSRIPPYMKPTKMRDLLSGMGTEVLRVYLAPEDTAIRARRVRAGGNKKKSFTEGWVEFDNKRRAKRIATTLNNSPVSPSPLARPRASGVQTRCIVHRHPTPRPSHPACPVQVGRSGRNGHRSFYASDLWNVRYLPKFKWHHLTEKVAAESRARQDKMRTELSQAKKESQFYLKKVDQAKAIDAMEERKRKRAQQSPGAEIAQAGDAVDGARDAKRGRGKLSGGSAAGVPNEGGGGGDDGGGDGLPSVRRRFKQRKQARDGTESAADDVLGLLAGR
mgnify:CR=1 FL=1